MARYKIIEAEPITGRAETWAEKTEREHMERLAAVAGLTIEIPTGAKADIAPEEPAAAPVPEPTKKK